MQTNNKDRFLSLDFGLVEFGEKDEKERMRLYRKFVYETGVMDSGKGAQIKESVVEKERKKDYKVTRTDRFSEIEGFRVIKRNIAIIFTVTDKALGRPINLISTLYEFLP